MSKRVSGHKGKKYWRRGIRAYRMGIEQTHAYRMKKAAEPGWLARMLGYRALDLKSGSRSIVSGWIPGRHEQPANPHPCTVGKFCGSFASPKALKRHQEWAHA